MINIPAVGALLRVLEAREGSPLAPPLVAVIDRVPAVKPVNADGASEQTPYRSTPERENRVAADAPPLRRAMPSPGAFAEDEGVALMTETAAKTVSRALIEDAPARPTMATARASGAPSPVITGSALPSAPPAPPAALLQLSGAAHLVQALLQMPARAGDSAVTQASAPLLEAPPGNGVELAKALARAVSTSGLFYESHLAAWTTQQHSAADLQQEPQAQWAALASSIAMAAASGPPDPSHPSSVPENALPLLRQQLQTLETRQVTWQGDLWPQQRATLAITEEEPGPAATAPRAWRARLDVELPTLGIVHADFSLNGNALQIMLSAALPETVDQLRSAQVELVGALAAHALDVTGVGFRHDAA